MSRILVVKKKPRITRNNGAWCCFSEKESFFCATWLKRSYIVTGYGQTPRMAYSDWSRK